MRSKGFGLWVVASVLVFLLTSGLAAAQKDKDVLILGTTDRVSQLSFANSYDYFSWHVLQQTTECLVTLPPNSTDVGPSLAERWDVSPDGKTYTFHLRKGVKFWDGEPFNAAAMKWALDRAIRLNGPEGAVGLISGIKNVEVVDTYTLKITVEQPDATFLARMADPIAPTMACSPKSTPADDFANGRYAGTGPYRLVEYVPEERVVYEAFPGYWGPKPKISKVVTQFYSDAAALRSAIEAGQIDVAFRTLNPQDIVSLGKNPNLQVIKGTSSLSVRYIVFNVTQKPFDDERLRQAVSYAVDRNRIVGDVFGGINTPLYSMVPPGLWSSTDVFPKRDLAKCKQMLAGLGYTDKNKLKITLWYTPLHYGTTEADVAAVLKSSLEETGVVAVDVQSLEWGTYLERQAEGSLGMFLLGWYPDFTDPDNFLAPWLIEAPGPLGTHLDKATSAKDKETYAKFDQLLGDAKKTTDVKTRTRMYQDAQRLLATSSILIPLWQNYQQHVAVAKKNVKGIVLDASMNLRLWLIYKE